MVYIHGKFFYPTGYRNGWIKEHLTFPHAFPAGCFPEDHKRLYMFSKYKRRKITGAAAATHYIRAILPFLPG